MKIITFKKENIQIMIDYHIHTRLCNHAKGTMEEYIQSAVAKGLREICFLDHLTLTKAGRTLSMAPDEVPLYFQAVQILKRRYKGTINIKAGLEIDFNQLYVDRISEIVQTYSFDLIGSSIHFLNDCNIVSSNSKWKDRTTDIDKIYHIYFESLEKMLEYDYFDVICHFDMIKKFNHIPSISFDKEIDSLLQKIKEKDIALEVNTSGYNHPVNDIYPGKEILKKCRKADIKITLGSDAHSPEEVGQFFDKATAILISSGYTSLTTFSKQKPGKISLI